MDIAWGRVVAFVTVPPPLVFVIAWGTGSDIRSSIGDSAICALILFVLAILAVAKNQSDS